MKRLMNQASSEIIDGVGSWDFDPRNEGQQIPMFSGLDEVSQRLQAAFAGRTLTFAEIIEQEMACTHFTESNYRDALLELEAEGRIEVNPAAEMRPFQAGRRKRTMSNRTQIRFPI